MGLLWPLGESCLICFVIKMLCVLLSNKSVLASWHQHSVTTSVWPHMFTAWPLPKAVTIRLVPTPWTCWWRLCPEFPEKTTPSLLRRQKLLSHATDRSTEVSKHHLFSKSFLHVKSGGGVSDPVLGQTLFTSDPPATPSSPSKTLEGLFELVRRPSGITEN